MSRRANSPTKPVRYTTVNDRSDRKALEELVDKLFNKRAVAKTEKSLKPNESCSNHKQLPTTSKGKHSPTKKMGNKSRSQNRTSKDNSKKVIGNGKITKRGKNKSPDHKQQTLNRWIKKDKALENCNVIEQKSANDKKQKPGKRSESKALGEKNKKTFKRSSSGSFDKYGISTPSFQDVLEYQQQLENQKRCLESCDALDDTQESLEFNLEEPKAPVTILDCKHLTNDELSKAFKKNYQYIHDIFHGITFSIRHNQFWNGSAYEQSNLTFNTSMIMFTYEQKNLLLSFLDDKFSDGKGLNGTNNTQYFFKVLLPELCTKIFMDVHDMDLDEATKYLEDRPAQHRIF